MVGFLNLLLRWFQHTAARRRLVNHVAIAAGEIGVSTHSRPKAAGRHILKLPPSILVSTHSRPKAAGFGFNTQPLVAAVSTHSRPKAAGIVNKDNAYPNKFQHTAARRRLAMRPRCLPS